MPQTPEELQRTVAALQENLKRIEAMLAGTGGAKGGGTGGKEKSPDPTGQNPPANDPQAQRLQEMDKRIKALEEALARVPTLARTVARLNDQVGTLDVETRIDPYASPCLFYQATASGGRWAERLCTSGIFTSSITGRLCSSTAHASKLRYLSSGMGLAVEVGDGNDFRFVSVTRADVTEVCKLENTGGSAGSATTPCTLTYRVKDQRGTVLLLSATPEWERSALGVLQSATRGLIRRSGTSTILVYAHEVDKRVKRVCPP